MVKTVLLCASAALAAQLFSGAAHAAAYHVDATGGNDAFDGLQPIHQGGNGGPWKTIARVNKTTFHPGDVICFKRGETWSERLVIRCGGSPGQPITIGACGAGRRPVIDVRKKEPAAITCFHSHVTFRDLTLMNSMNNALGVACIGGCKGIAIINVEVRNAGNNGVSISKGGDGIHIDTVAVYNAANNGIHLGGSPENKLSNVLVENCRISGVGANDGITIHEDGERNSAGTNFVLRNNHAEHCAEQGFDITTGDRVLLLNNTSSKNKQGGVVVGHSARNVTIQGHRSTDEPTTETSAAINIGGTSPHVKLVNCVIEGNGYHLLRITSSDVQILHNHFVWNGGGATFDIGEQADNVVVKNNIFTTRRSEMGRIRFLEPTRPPNHGTFQFDYNLYFAPSKVTIYSRSTKKNYTFAQYRSVFGVEAHSREVDPEFVDRAGGNYRLKDTSPAIDAGTDAGVKEDMEGHRRPADGNGDGQSAFDIGAYEYQPGKE